MRPTVVVLISKTGKVTVEVSGVQGQGCDAISSAFEEALGKVTDKTYKPERWITTDQAQAQG